jgi:hypothetical protein
LLCNFLVHSILLSLSSAILLHELLNSHVAATHSHN